MIILKNDKEIQLIGSAGRIVAVILKQLVELSRQGIALKELDQKARLFIKSAGAEPAFLNYQPGGASRPYMAAICTSVNEVIVHGVPDDYLLREGDLLKLDLGVKKDGFCADAAVTVGIGKISEKAANLMRATQDALTAGIRAAKAGNYLGDIGYAIKMVAKENGFKVIKGLTGHGIGRKLHEEPSVFNEGRPKSGLLLRTGIVLAIEPMFSLGSDRIVQLDDDSYATSDGSLSVQFEHTVAITDKGPQILTVI